MMFAASAGVGLKMSAFNQAYVTDCGIALRQTGSRQKVAAAHV